ncbi:unnamed protein product, partial [Amoebophrya sp. A120]|eukprot:GSA120T00024578001.1
MSAGGTRGGQGGGVAQPEGDPLHQRGGGRGTPTPREQTTRNLHHDQGATSNQHGKNSPSCVDSQLRRAFLIDKIVHVLEKVVDADLVYDLESRSARPVLVLVSSRSPQLYVEVKKAFEAHVSRNLKRQWSTAHRRFWGMHKDLGRNGQPTGAENKIKERAMRRGLRRQQQQNLQATQWMR